MWGGGIEGKDEGEKAGQKGEIMGNGNKRRKQRHLSHTERTSGAGPTDVLVKSVSGLCPRYNLNYRTFFTCTLCSISRKTSETKTIIVEGIREMGTTTFMECLGVSQGNMVEGPLWRKTLRRNPQCNGSSRKDMPR